MIKHMAFLPTENNSPARQRKSATASHYVKMHTLSDSKATKPLRKSNSSPNIIPPVDHQSTGGRRLSVGKKLKSLRNKIPGVGKHKRGISSGDHVSLGEATDEGSESAVEVKLTPIKNNASSQGGKTKRDKTPPTSRIVNKAPQDEAREQRDDSRETIESSASPKTFMTAKLLQNKQQKSASAAQQQSGLNSSPPRIAMPAVTHTPFHFISDDNFTRRVSSYDGQVIVCSDSKAPTYEVGNYLGGGVAGVVYEGRRLRPAHEYPPTRVGGGGAFYPTFIAEGIGARPQSPISMTMSQSSISSVHMNNPSDSAEMGTGLFADVYRSLIKSRTLPTPTRSPSYSFSQRSDLVQGSPQRPESGNCTSMVFSCNGPCGGSAETVDDTTPAMDNAIIDDDGASPTSRQRYKAVDMASIEIPAGFSSMDIESPPKNSGVHHVVVDDADAPNRSRREARALSRNNPQAKTATNSTSSGIIDDDGNDVNIIEDMSETVAIKILNPVGFKILPPESLNKAVIVREGLLPAVRPDGSFELTEDHVWWLINPSSRNLRHLMKKSHHSRGTPSPQRHKHDDASEESSDIKRQSSTLSHNDRGTPDKGLRLSLVATYVDPVTSTLTELPLPRCVEIWGHPPFAATDQEFDAMVETLLRLNAGSSMGIRRARSSRGNDPLANRKGGSTVYCPALSAYIAIPAIPPKYLRWLKQRRLATKEVRNMMRIGRHRNVVHLYEVLELVQDSKSTMFLILELVRGGELFDLISSTGSKKKGERTSKASEEHEETMRKFFRELASGINFIHKCGVAHRDLKPENLLIHTKPVKGAEKNQLVETPEEERTLKIADFGLSSTFQIASLEKIWQGISRGDSASYSRWDGNSVFDSPQNPQKRQSLGLPLSPQSDRGAPKSAGFSPLLNRVSATALSMFTCGNMINVCGGDWDPSDQAADNGLIDDASPSLRRMNSVVGSPHYVAPEIISQADKKDTSNNNKSPKNSSTPKEGYVGTKADVWSAGVILYAMLFRSLPFGEDLLRCPRYQAFFKWYNDARQLNPLMTGKKNRRAFPDYTLDPNYDEFDEEEMLGPHWFFPTEISVEGRDLIVAMLNPNPNDRVSVEMVLQHPWLNPGGGRVAREPSVVQRMNGLCLSGT